MAKGFKKLLKRAAPSPKKLTPKFVAKNEKLSNAASANLVFRGIRQNSSIAKGDWKNTKQMRASLREQHELSTSPHSKTSKQIYQRNQLPEGDPERDRLTAQINASTLRRGRVGIAVGGTVVGGAAGAAIKAGGAAATRENPTPNDAPYNMVDTWPDPRFYPDPMQQMYSRYPDGAPFAQTRGRRPGGVVGGLLSSVIGLFHSLLVPPPRGAAAGPNSGTAGMFNVTPGVEVMPARADLARPTFSTRGPASGGLVVGNPYELGTNYTNPDGTVVRVY